MNFFYLELFNRPIRNIKTRYSFIFQVIRHIGAKLQRHVQIYRNLFLSLSQSHSHLHTHTYIQSCGLHHRITVPQEMSDILRCFIFFFYVEALK